MRLAVYPAGSCFGCDEEWIVLFFFRYSSSRSMAGKDLGAPGKRKNVFFDRLQQRLHVSTRKVGTPYLPSEQQIAYKY